MMKRRVEWPTILLLALCYLAWGVATTWLAQMSLLLAVVLLILTVVMHSSLTHEAVHGHPTRIGWINALLLFPALGLFIPYGRFRDTHLDHHRDSLLTDPYDDPESNYLDPAVWVNLPGWFRVLLRFNNTLAGRLLVGPAVGQVSFMRADWALIRKGDKQVLMSWLGQIPAIAVVVLWLAQLGMMPFWAYFIGAYVGLSILKIRTFLEHRAHDRASARTVVIEDRGILAFLFLNNSLHVVHHMHPTVAWYNLPALYAGNKAHYLKRNGGYRYDSYREIFSKYFLRAKDPVPHPLWTGAEAPEKQDVAPSPTKTPAPVTVEEHIR